MTATPPPSIRHAALTAGILASMGVPARESFAVHPPDDAFEPGRVVAFDAAHFADAAPDEFLSHHAAGGPAPDPASPDGLRRFLAPDVASNKQGFVEYPLYHYADPPRAAGVDFPTLRHPSCQLVTQRIANRGLAVEVDEDAEPPDADWRPAKVAFLRGVLDRARLRRTVRLFVAGAVNVGKSWSAPGADPDMDIIDELETQTLRASRVWYGPDAWARRARACPVERPPQDLAAEFTVEEVRVGPPRERPGPAVTEDDANSQVLLFCAADSLGRNDFSNLKTFVSPAGTGGRYAVYLRRVGVRRWRLGVECHETVAITSTMGLEVVTVS